MQGARSGWATGEDGGRRGQVSRQVDRHCAIKKKKGGDEKEKEKGLRQSETGLDSNE